MSDSRKPNWSVWLNVQRVALWEGVGLTLDIEPHEVRHSPHSWMVESHLFEESKDFLERLFLATRNLGASGGLIPTVIDYECSEDCEVNLRQFVLWAVSLGWGMPAELAELANRPVIDSSSTNVPVQSVTQEISGKERNYLLRIIRVLADMAKLPTGPHKAASIVEQYSQSMGVQLNARAVAEKLKAAARLED